MDPLIREFKRQSSHIDQQLHDCRKAMSKLSIEVNKLEEDRSLLPLWNKITTFFKHSKRLNSLNESLIEKRHQSRKLTRELEKLKRALLFDFITSSIKDSHLRTEIDELKQSYKVASRLEASAKNTLSLAKSALNEISEAESAVSSAQSYELIDMATNNKGLSLISTLSTSSANAEMSDAANAIKRFTDALAEHRDLSDNLRHSMVWEWTDLIFDLTVENTGFDFTSVISYFALSSASSNLNAAARQIKKTLTVLGSQHSNYSAAKSSVEKRLRDHIKTASQTSLDLLLSAGVEVTESELSDSINLVSKS